MEKCWTGKNRGNVEAELREQWTPLLQSRPAERLFVRLWSSANPFHTTETPELSHIKPESVRITDSQDGWSSQRCRPCMLGGPLKLHIILVFIIFSHRATALTQGLFVSVCLLCPSTPTAPHASSLLHWTHLALGFHFGWRIPVCQWFPFSSAPVPLVQLWPEEAFGWGRRVPLSWKFVSLFPQKATLRRLRILTAHFAARMSSEKSPWRGRATHSQSKHFLTWSCLWISWN